MNIKLRKEDFLDYVIYLIVVFNILIFRWLNITDFTNVVLLILIILSITKSLKNYLTIIAIAFAIIPIYMIVNNHVNNGSFLIAASNYKSILVSLILLWYFSNLIRTKAKTMFTFLHYSFSIFNIFAIINVPIILLQLSGNRNFDGFMPNTNTYIPDLASGLFGANGIPELALFSSFIIVYNFYYRNTINDKSKKNVILIYNFILILVYSLLSLFNDNKFFYVILLVYLIIYYLVNLQLKNKNKKRLLRYLVYLRKSLFGLALVGLVTFILYNFTMIGNDINQMLHDFQLGINRTYLVQGSNERFGMISFILQDKLHRWWGYGIGYVHWTTPYTFGFMHYGQSDMGTFMCLGGIAYIIVICFYVIKCIFNCIHSHIIAMLLVITVFLLSIYTQIFTVATLMGTVILYISLCGIDENRVLI